MKYVMPIILFMASLAYSANISPNAKIEEFDDFSSGLNTQKNKSKLNRTESPHIENALIDEQPTSIVERSGMIVAGRIANLSKINFGFEQVSDNNAKLLYVSDSSQVYATSDLTTFSLIKATLTATANLNAAQGRGYTLFANGIDPLFISSGLPAVPLDGQLLRPNPLRGKYVTYNQERFFTANSTTNCSALEWMALSSTGGYSIPIDDVNAWPVLNQLNIGQGDGACISGLDVYKGQLQIHKSNKSIYTLYGTDETTYFARKTNSNSGANNSESIAQIDNTEYYFAKDGVNGFNSADSTRVSDDIFPDMQTVISSLINLQAETWDTYTQFMNKGNLQNSTATLDGFVATVGTITANGISATYTGPGSAGVTVSNTGINASSTTGFQTVAGDSIKAGFNYSGFITSYTVWEAGQSGNCNSLDSVDDYFTFTFRNSRTNSYSTSAKLYIKNLPGFPSLVNSTVAPNMDVTDTDLRSGNLSIKLDIVTNEAACGTTISSFTVNNTHEINGSVFYVSTNTSNYVSYETTVAAVSAWGTFDTIQNTNGGNINYYIKASTTLLNLRQTPYVSVMPGNTIPFSSSRTFVQWSATMSAVGVPITSSTYIDSVILNHNDGGASDSAPKAIEWKKRYLILVTTQTAGTITPIYVKSKITNPKPNAWTRYTFGNDYFKSIFKFNDNLYLGSGSTGTVYRFDYGTNDNGSPIVFYYETPNTNKGNNWTKKNQYEYLLDADNSSGGNLTILTSIDGNAFSTNTVSVGLSGSGGLIRSIKSPNIPKIGKSYSYGLSNAELDKHIVIHSFGVISEDTGIRD